MFFIITILAVIFLIYYLAPAKCHDRCIVEPIHEYGDGSVATITAAPPDIARDYGTADTFIEHMNTIPFSDDFYIQDIAGSSTPRYLGAKAIDRFEISGLDDIGAINFGIKSGKNSSK